MLSVLGSGLVYLEPLLAGEPVVSTVCNFGVVRTLETDRLTHARVLRGPWSCPLVSASPLLYGKFVGPGRDEVWPGVVALWKAAGHFDGHLCGDTSSSNVVQVSHPPHQEPSPPVPE